MSDLFVCDTSRCKHGELPAMCARWRFECVEGSFRRLVSDYRRYGDWCVHEWADSDNFYAKLFGPKGFVTIEDITHLAGHYRVSVRLRLPAGEAEWLEFYPLSIDDGSLARAVAHACELAGIEERSAV